MKIYTKKGDRGQTSLIGGNRVAKNHIRIEAYGTVDELNSYTGILRSFTSDKTQGEVLQEIQDRLFTIGSLLASAPDSKMIVPDLHAEDTALLEENIDLMNQSLEPLRAFVLPAGSAEIAHCHVARCICRRAERLIVHVDEIEPVHPEILAYMNRLSDYLFVLARFSAFKAGIKEVEWKPRN